MKQSDIEKKLGVTFKNKNLLMQALTHRSFLNENRNWPVENYERLEFLGDAVIELLVTESIYAQFPDKNEGELTELRSRLVSTKALAYIGGDLCLFDHLRLSRGEKIQNGGCIRAQERLTACVFEAVVGALYLDQGYGAVSKLLERCLLSRIDQVCLETVNHKSLLQEKAQGILKVTPSYKVLKESGPAHNKQFVIGIYFGSSLIAKGHGPSKQLAETKAAEAALIIKGWIRSPI